MNLPQWMTESLYVQRIGWTLLQSLWQGALIAALLAVMLAMLRRRGPRVRYALCCLAMAALALAPLATFFTNVGSTARTPSPSMAPRASTTIVEHDAGVHANTLPQGDGAATLPNVSAPSSIHGSPQLAQVPLSQRALAILSSWIPWLVPLWVIGVLALSLWNLITWCLVQRLASSHTLPVDAALQQLARRLAGRLGLAQLVRLAQSPAVNSPVVIGMFKPLILLPISIITELPVSQLEALIAHELAHVLRHDYLVNLLQIGTETLLFYHPATWWISSCIRAEREHCCDDLAIVVTQNRTAYVCALAHVAGVRMPSLTPAACGGALLPRLRRVLGMSNTPVDRPSRSLAGVSVSVLCLIGAVVIGSKMPTASLHAAPPAVSKIELDPNHFAGLVFAGRVLSPDGMPVPAARVSMFLNERFGLLHEPKQPEVGDGQTVTADLILPRDPATVLTGRVVNAEGVFIAGATIVAEGGKDSFGTRETQADVFGRFSFSVPIGAKVSAVSQSLSTSIPVDILGGEKNLVLRLQPVAEAALVVSVVDIEGRPVKGSRIKLAVDTGGHSESHNLPLRVTNAKGQYTFEKLRTDWRCSLWVDADGYGVIQATVEPLTMGRQNAIGPMILLPEDDRVAGHVTGKDGKPMAGITVEINGGTGNRTTLTDDAGHFQLNVVKNARFSLYLRNVRGDILGGLVAQAGEMNLKLIYDPERINPAKKEIDP